MHCYACNPHEHWRGFYYTDFKVTRFWPNTKNCLFHSDLHKSQIISHKQSTITLEPFWSCTNRAQKSKENEVDFLLSLLIYKNCPLQVYWDTGNQWICLQTEQKGGSWEEFTATATHLEMMSSREKKKQYALCSLRRLVNRAQVPWLYHWHIGDCIGLHRGCDKWYGVCRVLGGAASVMTSPLVLNAGAKEDWFDKFLEILNF